MHSTDYHYYCSLYTRQYQLNIDTSCYIAILCTMVMVMIQEQHIKQSVWMNNALLSDIVCELGNITAFGVVIERAKFYFINLWP